MIFTRMILIYLLFVIPFLALAQKNFTPSSGRSLSYGHWLTCSTNGLSLMRSAENNINKDTPSSHINPPNLSGSFRVSVSDTWTEMVTKSGWNCFRCGQKPNKSDGSSGDCNYCSWQEEETFYRPWSTQNVDVRLNWKEDNEYQQKRKNLLSDRTKTTYVEKKKSIEERLSFDEDRPSAYYLFPGEFETFSIGQGFFTNSNSETINLAVKAKDVRHQYEISQKVNHHGGQSLICDDQDIIVQVNIEPVKRLITKSPNSIEFRTHWIEGHAEGDRAFEEPFKFHLVDLGAFVYEGQNFYSHFKDTKVWIRLRQINRFWWFDRFISDSLYLDDTISVAKLNEVNEPPYAIYKIKGEELFKTRSFPILGLGRLFGKSKLHLSPGESYEVCTSVLRGNNIYYIPNKWSDLKCATFIYDDSANDLRSGLRGFRDWMTGWFPIPLFWW